MPAKLAHPWQRYIAILALAAALLLPGIVPANAATGTASISGKIQAPAGTDLTKVSILPASSAGGSSVAAKADGTFTVTGLAAGTYRIDFDGPNLIRQSIESVTLQEGQALALPTVTLVKGATISGKLTGTAPDDLKALYVQAFDSTGTKSYSYVFPNTDGTYTLTKLPAGTYKIMARDVGRYVYSPALSFIEPKYASQWYSGAYTVSTAQGVAVSAGATKSGIDFALVLGGEISGTVEGLNNEEYACVGAFLEGTTPSLVSVTQQQPAPASKRLQEQPQAAAGDPCYHMLAQNAVAHTSVNSDGSYTIRGLPAGSYRIYQAVPFTWGEAGQQNKTSAPQWFNAKILRSSAASTSLAADGSVSGIDFSLFPERTFTDIPAGTQFHREISWLGSTGVSTGFPDGTYAPLNSVNRDAMAAFLYRLAGSPSFTPPASSPFTDVATDNPFYKHITWLAGQGISTGWTETDGTKTYRPLQSVNRDAMAAFLYRFAGSPGYTPPANSPFADVATNNQFYKQITWLANTGITTGWTEANGTKTFRPLSPVNRDAMAAFLYRYGVFTGSIL
ncbi:carboxypeptidase regulatory-like domain-containing protein [Paenarthrobacter nitroguajacolicus]|uniref:carboxypeptidase regulatory-like domain-containing protein n=1 Tax=Paenarthrobacter nitroguajacolicus TaxID=211146 RepID=UPI000AC649FB|nr:carboxypeptidase regulatory-like domain-containing protein [Paenarthrobacter nitroguajacolicus]